MAKSRVRFIHTRNWNSSTENKTGRSYIVSMVTGTRRRHLYDVNKALKHDDDCKTQCPKLKKAFYLLMIKPCCFLLRSECSLIKYAINDDGILVNENGAKNGGWWWNAILLSINFICWLPKWLKWPCINIVEVSWLK